MRYLAILLIVVSIGAYYANDRNQEARQRTIDAEAQQSDPRSAHFRSSAIFRLRRQNPLLANDLMRGSNLLLEELSEHEDGWRRRALRAAMVS